MVNGKHAFWQALVFTIVVFAIGIIFGFFIEGQRSNQVELNAMKSEINFIDAQIRNNAITEYDVSCELAKTSNFAFADKIYNEAYKLEKLDASNKFTDTLKESHKRYDLLRMMLWNEAIHIKKSCGQNFHTVVYLFNYDEQDVDIRAEQATYARVLTDIKAKYPDRVLLIPIAANMDLESINFALDYYNVNRTPAIIIDEKIVIDHIPTIEQMENVIFNSNKE
jgi:hypothetical protein